MIHELATAVELQLFNWWDEMEESLKILDSYDRRKNIYQLVVECARKGHEVMNSADPWLREEPTAIIRVVLSRYLKENPE